MTISFNEYMAYQNTLKTITENYLNKLLAGTDDAASKIIINHLLTINRDISYTETLQREANYRLQEAGVKEPSLAAVETLAKDYAEVCVIDMDETAEMARDFVSINDMV